MYHLRHIPYSPDPVPAFIRPGIYRFRFLGSKYRDMPVPVYRHGMYRCRLSHGIHRWAFRRPGILAYTRDIPVPALTVFTGWLSDPAYTRDVPVPVTSRCRLSRYSLVWFHTRYTGTDTACTDSGTLALYAGSRPSAGPAYTGSPDPANLPGTLEPASLPGTPEPSHYGPGIPYGFKWY
jgi:hypothetical protein